MAQRGTHKLRLSDQKVNLEWALDRDWTGSPPTGGDALQSSGKGFLQDFKKCFREKGKSQIEHDVKKHHEVTFKSAAVGIFSSKNSSPS